QRAAWQRFVDARDAMAGRQQARAAQTQQQEVKAPAEALVAPRRVEPAGRGLEGLERRAAEEQAAPGAISRTTMREGQDIPLYSALRRALDDPRVKQAADAGDPALVRQRLKEAGVTEEEMDWTDTGALLRDAEALRDQGMVLPYEALVQHVAENAPEVREVALGTDPAKAQALRAAVVEYDTARAAQARDQREVENQFARDLVAEGLYDIPAGLQGGSDEASRIADFLARVAQHHLNAARSEANGLETPERIQAIHRRASNQFWDTRRGDLVRWTDDPALEQRLHTLSREHLRRWEEARVQGEYRAQSAAAAMEAAERALWPTPGQPQPGSRQPGRSPDRPRWSSYSSTARREGMAGEAEGYREFVAYAPQGSRIGQRMAGQAIGGAYQHGHWMGVPNPLIHFRVTIRSLPDGRRVVYVEEIQTDLHQAAREEVRERNSGRVQTDPTTGKPLRRGYMPSGFVAQSESDPRVVARRPLWEAEGRAQEALRAVDRAEGQWRLAPDPDDPRGRSRMQQWEDDLDIRFWRQTAGEVPAEGRDAHLREVAARYDQAADPTGVERARRWESLAQYLRLRPLAEAQRSGRTNARMALDVARYNLDTGRDQDVLQADLFILGQRVNEAQAEADRATAAFDAAIQAENLPQGARSTRPETELLRIEAQDANQRVSDVRQRLRDESYKADPNLTERPPEAPFRESWVNVALKRALKLAADEGLDGIALTSGEIAAQRVNAAQQVTRLRYEPDRNELHMSTVDGDEVTETVSEGRLRQLVGDATADELIARAYDDEQGRVQEERDRADEEAFDRAREDFDEQFESQVTQEEGESDEDFFARQDQEREDAWEWERDRINLEGDYDYIEPARGEMGQDELGDLWTGNKNLITFYNVAVRNAARKLANRLGTEPFETT
ncbi:MAG TPA: hypothetical protein VFS70_04000, partial [Actinomycetota bacterium]|nr:hypothetical protein [Actinomycetota bacterium]